MPTLKKFWINLSTMTFASTQILLFTLAPVLSEKLQLSLSTLVGSFALGTFLFLWSGPYWTNRSDKLGREKVMIIGLIGLAASFILITMLFYLSTKLSQKESLTYLLLSRIIYGVFASAIIPMAQLIRSEMTVATNQLRAMFSHSLSLSLGRTIGPLLLIICFGRIEILLLCLSVWCCILVLINYRESQHTQTIEKRAIEKYRWSTVAQEMKGTLLITILFTTYTGVLHSTLGETLKISFELKSSEASELMAWALVFSSLVMAIIQVIGKILAKNHLRKTLFIGLAGLSLGAIWINEMTQLTQLWPAIGLISLGIALIYPSNLALLHKKASNHLLSQKVGLLASGNIIGYVLGGSLASLFFDNKLHIISYVIIAALIVASWMTSQKEVL